MARKDKPIDLNNLIIIKPLMKYRITIRGSDPVYVEANDVDIYGKAIMIQRHYENYSQVVCVYSEDEWEKVELVSAFPEET